MRSAQQRTAAYSGNYRGSPMRLRFIIEQQMPERNAAGPLPSVLGYFLVKHEGHWLRLASIA